MTAPLVSCVLLTTHPKRAAFLPDALRSYRQQTWPARELVVVNDGSPLAPRAADVRVVNLPPIGRPWTIGEKRNVGVRASRGVYLATWDDDDVSLPERLASQVEYALRCDADVVLADRMTVADSDMNLVGACHRGRQRPVQASALLARSAVVAAGGYPAVSYREDAELLERLRYVVRARIVTQPGCDYYVMRRHGANVTLAAGERDDAYFACALGDVSGRLLQARVDAVRAGAGADDVAAERTDE